MNMVVQHIQDTKVPCIWRRAAWLRIATKNRGDLRVSHTIRHLQIFTSVIRVQD